MDDKKGLPWFPVAGLFGGSEVMALAVTFVRQLPAVMATQMGRLLLAASH